MVSIWVLYFTHLTTYMSPTVVKDKVELFKQDTMLHVSYDNVSMSTNVTRCHQTQWYRVTIMMAHCIIRALYFGHLKQVIVRMTYVTRVELIPKTRPVYDFGTWMPVLLCHGYAIQNMLATQTKYMYWYLLAFSKVIRQEFRFLFPHCRALVSTIILSPLTVVITFNFIRSSDSF